MIYLCGQSNRRERVLASPAVNGIDYLEVLGPPGCGTKLAITFLKDPTSLALTKDNVIVTDGAPVTVKGIVPPTAQDPNVITVQLNQTGDFAPYTLSLRAVQVSDDGTIVPTQDPPDGLDSVLSTVSFSFKAGCPTPADCLMPSQPQPPPPPPDVNYLARDYDGFRQVMLDRLAVLAPAWTERHAADLGIVLVEALAYAADHLSYAQDAVGTEAYIGTARSRISLRRHSRLVDYPIGEGCIARTLIALTTTMDDLTVPAGTRFYPAAPGLPAAGSTTDPLAARLSGTGPVFASIQDTPLATEQNEISFYTWGDGDCCLPAGATSATLTGNLTSLAKGSVLVFEEVRGPGTGAPEDADPAYRHAVWLTCVRLTDHTNAPLTDPLTDTPVTEISWAPEDALPFPLCLSTTVNGAPVSDVSVARGNIVLADHGTRVNEELPGVPKAGRYYPALKQAPVSFGIAQVDLSSAAGFLTEDPSSAVPVIALTDSEGGIWTPQPDLLTRTSDDRNFVVEVEHDGTAYLRFGDGEHGALPSDRLTFTATYQVGNGTAGNVGQDALGHAVIPQTTPPVPAYAITAVRNPLPVTSGADPEPADHIRRFAPFDFQRQERCVTENDYGQQAKLLPGVREARGELRWTGSWYTAFVSVDPGGVDVSGPMDRLRMLGTDVAAETAIIVGLRIALAICVDAAHFRGDVHAAIMARFTGPGGILNAANFSFGQRVYASPLITAAQAIEGVLSVTLATFSRLDQPWVDGVADGFLTLGRLEIPRCDNDPDHLDHGLFIVTLDGGK